MVQNSAMALWGQKPKLLLVFSSAFPFVWVCFQDHRIVAEPLIIKCLCWSQEKERKLKKSIERVTISFFFFFFVTSKISSQHTILPCSTLLLFLALNWVLWLEIISRVTRNVSIWLSYLCSRGKKRWGELGCTKIINQSYWHVTLHSPENLEPLRTIMLPVAFFPSFSSCSQSCHFLN